MVHIDITYTGGLRCEAVHEPSGRALTTDAPVDNHGRGETFSPTDLVATALGTCMVTIMGIFAGRHGWNIDGTRIGVDKKMTGEGPRRIARLSVSIDVPHALDENARKTLENAAHTCPVRLSLLPAIDVPVAFRWG